jgi:rhodanese-related sulfurtransferase
MLLAFYDKEHNFAKSIDWKAIHAELRVTSKPIVTISAAELWDLLKGKWVVEGKPVFIRISNAKEHVIPFLTETRRLNFPAKDFEAKVAKLDRDKAYLVYCQNGEQSARSLPTWRRFMFGKIYHLKGGMEAYLKHISGDR